MKKKTLMKMLPLTIMAVVIMGCSNQGTAIQRQPQTTQSTQPQTAPATQPQTAPAAQPQAAPAAQPQAAPAAQPQTAPAADTAMADLQKSVDAAQAEVNDLAARIAAGDRNAYAALKQEESALSNKLDLLEDQLEQYYMQGKCDMDAYQKLDGMLDLMDETLDNAMDSLELALGIDD